MTPKKIRFAELKYHWPIYFFVIPSVIMIALFEYYPAASGVFHSFYRWNGADINEYIGYKNYTDLLKDPAFWQSFSVSITIGFWNVLKMIPALAVAVCIHRCRSDRMRFFYRILFVAPMVIPGLIVVLVWRTFFFEAVNGYLNRFLMTSHIFDVLVWLDPHLGWGGIFKPGLKAAWLGDGRLILFACVAWGFPWVGSFAVLTHLAKLGGISKDLYEAAELDGASWWTKFTKIELPLVMGSINLLLVFLIIDTIKDAGMILALAGMYGGPGGVVTVPALFMLQKAFLEQQMGAACAVGIVLTLIVIILQKLLNQITDWESLTKTRRIFARIAGATVAILLYKLMGHRLVPLAILALVTPWGAIADLIRSFFTAPAAVTDTWKFSAAQLAARARSDARLANPAFLARQRWKAGFLRSTKHGFIWFVLAFAYLPMYLMVIVSFKTNKQFYNAPAVLTTPLHPENWRQAWDAVIPALANSIFTTTAATTFTIFIALAAAYFFARVKVPGSTFLWNAILILMMMPTIANLVPLFKLLISLNLANTLTALVLVGATGGQIVAIFMLRNFVADIPQDLFEAADIDGASHFRQLLIVVAPLSGPILGVVGINYAVAAWNDFVLPLIIMRDQARLPVMVALLRMSGEYIKLWGPLMAGYALASLPVIVLFVATMRLFTRGLTEGAVKG